MHTGIKVNFDEFQLDSCENAYFKCTYPKYLKKSLLKIPGITLINQKETYVEAIHSVETNPFVPEYWQKAGTKDSRINVFREERAQICSMDWLQARDFAVQQAQTLYALGVTEELCQQLLEPFMWQQGLIYIQDIQKILGENCPEYVVGTKIYHSVNAAKKEHLEKIKYLTPEDWMYSLPNKDIHLLNLFEKMYDVLVEIVPFESCKEPNIITMPKITQTLPRKRVEYYITQKVVLEIDQDVDSHLVISALKNFLPTELTYPCTFMYDTTEFLETEPVSVYIGDEKIFEKSYDNNREGSPEV